jgi:hypothetical protein
VNWLIWRRWLKMRSFNVEDLEVKSGQLVLYIEKNVLEVMKMKRGKGHKGKNDQNLRR